MSDWPFAELPGTPALTRCGVAFFDRPVLLVLHDVEGEWQLLDGEAPAAGLAGRAHVAGLAELCRRDPSLLELADLPRGWRAARAAPGRPWTRSVLGEHGEPPAADRPVGPEPAPAPAADQGA